MFYMDIGHWGVRKTYDLVAMKFLIKRMKLLIVEFVQTRPLCKRITPNRLATQGLFEHLPLHIAVDCVLGFHETWREGVA